MTAIMHSIRPQWCELIALGEKTMEIKKTRPKIEPPFKVYIYQTKGYTETPRMDEDGHMIFQGRGQVIGEYICDFPNRRRRTHEPNRIYQVSVCRS